MRKTMNLTLFYALGGRIEHELVYEGESMIDIARQIESDENMLLDYMRSGDSKGEKCFVLGGFMFRKDGILAAQITEGVI